MRYSNFGGSYRKVALKSVQYVPLYSGSLDMTCPQITVPRCRNSNLGQVPHIWVDGDSDRVVMVWGLLFGLGVWGWFRGLGFRGLRVFLGLWVYVGLGLRAYAP